MDFHSAYSGVNQGHCHPRIVAALTKQASVLTLTSRAMSNEHMGAYFKYMSETFGYDKIIPMNSGTEACETAVKVARRWGYRSKGIPENEARVLQCNANFWGRSISAISSSDDPGRYKDFGPYTRGFDLIPFNNLEALEDTLKSNPNYCAFMVEPIQGEAGIIIPDDDYLERAQQICKKYNVLLIADEVQTGLGRTGKLLCSEWSRIKPDITTLAKSLSGGMMS